MLFCILRNFFQPYTMNERKRLYATFRRELFSVYFPKAGQFGPGGVRLPPANAAGGAPGGLFRGRSALGPAPGLLGLGLGAVRPSGPKGPPRR